MTPALQNIHMVGLGFFLFFGGNNVPEKGMCETSYIHDSAQYLIKEQRHLWKDELTFSNVPANNKLKKYKGIFLYSSISYCYFCTLYFLPQHASAAQPISE